MITCKVCGSNKVENRDQGLCATHNKERLRGERPIVEKERKGLRPVSVKQAEQLKERAKGYKEVLKRPQHCACCGDTRFLTPSHILSQGQFPQHRANPRNVVILCQIDHHTFEHYKDKFKLMFPAVWEEKMQIMQELEPQEYERFKAKHPTLF
jgi:hypothetical protein